MVSCIGCNGKECDGTNCDGRNCDGLRECGEDIRTRASEIDVPSWDDIRTRLSDIDVSECDGKRCKPNCLSCTICRDRPDLLDDSHNIASDSSEKDEEPLIRNRHNMRNGHVVKKRILGLAGIFGVTTMWPWWIILMTHEFWIKRLADQGKGWFWYGFLIASGVSLTVASITNCLLTTKTSRKSRLYPAAAGSIISLIIFTVFIKVDTSKWTVGFYAMTMVFVIIYKSSMGFQNTLGTFLGHFPTVYLNKFVQGQAFAGVIISVLYILGVHFLKGDNGSQAMVLFTAGIMLSLISALMYYQLRRTNCTQEFWKVNTSNQNSSARYKSIAIDTARVIKGMKHEAIALTIVFTSTVAIFPSITKKAKSSASLAGDLYVPIFCFLFFSFFDWVGRVFATGCNKFINRDWAVIPSSTMRTVFMSLLILCKRSDNAGVWIFANDATFIVLMALFGLTQGYIVGAIFDRLPKVTAEGDREVAVAALLMFIHIGMMLGTALSYGIDAIIPHS